jgi:hypothetical protein
MGTECKPINSNCGPGLLKHDIRCFKYDALKKTTDLVDLKNCDLNDIKGLNKTCEVPCVFKWERFESAVSVNVSQQLCFLQICDVFYCSVRPHVVMEPNMLSTRVITRPTNKRLTTVTVRA